MRGFSLAIALALLAGGAAACSGDDCVELDVAACTPTYDPTFDNVFDRTLSSSCGVEGSSCHGAEGMKGGLVLDDADRAHALLLEGRVEPGDAACSEVVKRIESTSVGYKMPPGSRTLSAGERCAIEQWIQGGAAR